MADNLRISYDKVTRGRGKVFLRITVDGAPEGSRLVASAQMATGGQPVPATVMDLGGSRWVLSVAVINLVQVALVRLLDADGTELCRRRIHIRPQAARLMSQMHTALRDGQAESIRNLDSRGGNAGPKLLVHNLIALEEGEDLRATMVSNVVGEEAAHLPIKVTVLSQDGELLADDHFAMGDSCSASEGNPQLFTRMYTFGVILPKQARGIVLWVSAEGEGQEDSFVTLEGFYADWLRGSWRQSVLPADQEPRYEQWAREHSASAEELALMAHASELLPERPTFSLVVPLFKTPLDFFDEMADSVLSQAYPYFQLVLVNASPEDRALADEVATYAARDSRITVVNLDGNHGITENTNRGIEASTGDFVCFFDHDDTIEPDLLYWYAKAVSDRPDTDLIYCDEDHLLDGHRVGPFFKPDWDPERLCAENYVTHLLCVRRSVVEELPELPGSEFDGSQDHNMTFLVGERARNVYHVRRILYHWRMHANSTAGGQGVAQKSYALEAERRAVQGHLDRCGIDAEAVMGGRFPTRCDVRYRFQTHPLVSIVIPNYEMRDVLGRCIDSIVRRTTWPNYEIVVVENNSKSDEIFEYYRKLERDSRIRVVTCDTEGEFNFSRLINFGFAAARGQYLVMLNNDTEVISPDWVEQMVGPLMSSDMGAVGAKLLYPDGSIQHAGVLVGGFSGPVAASVNLPGNAPGYYEWNVLPHRASAVTGACLMTKRSVYDEVGGMDEREFKVNYNDIDLCLKIQAAGYHVLQQNYAVLRHYESISRHGGDSRRISYKLSRELMAFAGRWGQVLSKPDPYYNPNFRRDNWYCALS
ncbi:glycosyltransferase family 2 protein [Olsenella porci]|uniref:Glycosyltransferase n=1 Tax=Olsenella porci TaxID=2652279 RepID=A0A6N7X9Q1_9ACTN|nr:glycosyltransferase [Olsenella porci]MST72262.1 glycosyltransferase [Olsenella porci]